MPGKRPRTKKITTEEIVPLEEEQPQPAYVDPDEELLETVLGQFGGGSDVKVKVSKVENGQLQYIHTYPDDTYQVAAVDEAFLQRMHGGGKYTLRFYAQNQLVRVVTLNIAGDPNATVNAPQRQGLDPMTAMLMEDRKIMMQALFADRGDRSSVSEVAEAAKTIMTISGQQQQTPIDKMMEFFKMGMEIQARMNGGDVPGEGGWLGFAKDVARQAVPALLPAIGGLLAGGNGYAPQPGANSMIPAGAQQMLQQGLGYLKKKALAGKDPLLYVDFVMENRDDELYSNLIAMVCQSQFAEIAALDPQIGQEPYHGFFKALYDGIRESVAQESQPQTEVLASDDAQEVKEDGETNGIPEPEPITARDVNSIRPSGNARNAANNGGVSSRGGAKPKTPRSR